MVMGGPWSQTRWSGLSSGLVSAADRRVKEFANGVDRLIGRRLVEFKAIAEILSRCPQRWRIEAMIGVRKDDEAYRDALALVARYSQIVASVDQIAALDGPAPFVEFADQDQGRHGHVVLEAGATRIEGDRGAELVLRRSLDRAAFDRCQRQPAALRKSQRGNAIGIDDRLLHQKTQRPIGIECEADRRAVVAGIPEAAWTKTVDGER